MSNVNIGKDGIRYGIIAANSLDCELVDELMFGTNARDLSYEAAFEEFKEEVKRSLQNDIDDEIINESDFDEEFEYRLNMHEQEFNDRYMWDEPTIEGTHDGVKYRTTWLGGALHIWVFESPVTGEFVLCSPCVPNCCDLDSPQPGGCVGYDVPADWREAE